MRLKHFAVSNTVVIALLALGACGGPLPADCTDGCVDSCRDASMLEARACASLYIEEYRRGYALGFTDGQMGRRTDGINSDGFVDGYWDGVADGEVSRR